MTTRSTPRITEHLPQLRAHLDAAGYRDEEIRELLCLPDNATLPPAGHGPSRARLSVAAPTVLSLLTRLLLLGEHVRDEHGLLSGELMSLLRELRLIIPCEDGFRPLVRLTPFHGLVLAADLHNEDSTHVAVDVVENPHRPTDVLARLTPHTPVRRSLDIGTGSGAHALQLAAHSHTVLGVDASPRAVEFARFNACLNAITNVHFAMSDVVDDVGDTEPFDLIVSNPPYLISPETAVMYRDGAGPDHVGTRVLTEAPALLAPNGLLICLTSWPITDRNEPAAPIRDIAHRVRCNGLTWIHGIRTPLENAIRWNAHRTDTDELRNIATTWLHFYDQNDITEIAYGIVILTPCPRSTPWFRTEYVDLTNQRPDHGQIRDVIAALERTHRGQKPTRPHVHPDHEITTVSTITDDKPTTREQLLRSTRGIPFTVECGPRLLNMITTAEPAKTPDADSEVLSTMMHRLFELGLIRDDEGSHG